MPVEQTIVQLGEDEVRIESLPATEQLRLLIKLSKIAGGVGKGIKDIPQNTEELEQVLDLGAMIQGLLDKVEPDEVVKLIRDILRKSVVQWPGGPALPFGDWYEHRFSRHMSDQFMLLKAVFEWNYGDFVVWIKKHLAGLITQNPVAPAGSGNSQPQSSEPLPPSALTVGSKQQSASGPRKLRTVR